MSTNEELQRDCAYCRRPITLKWENRPMRSEGARLIRFSAMNAGISSLTFMGSERPREGERQNVERLIAEHGADVKLPHLLTTLANGPEARSISIRDRRKGRG